jgi:Bacterial protein of unknown function (DUF937)
MAPNLPLIKGGRKKQMEKRGGEDRAKHILNKYGSESVLDNTGGLFASGAKKESPDPGLGGLLENSCVQATDKLVSRFNIDSNMAKKIIPMLAPVVLGALKSKRDIEGAGASGIAVLIDQDEKGEKGVSQEKYCGIGKWMNRNSILFGMGSSGMIFLHTTASGEYLNKFLQLLGERDF